MKQKILYAILLVGMTMSAQKVKITGFVKDSVGNPLEMANVIAYKKTDNTMTAYGITNSNGKYGLSVPANETYLLKVSFIGLSAKDRTITVNVEDVKVDFEMTSEENSLDEVEIVYEIPVVVKGDTLVYNTDSFTNGNEKKLGDVLDKLPGIEVNDDGEIEVEGKTVSKVMIEGKDFFDGDSKLATKNIPADALDKVEVLRNYEDVGQMRGLRNNQDQVAINIKLKEGKKNFWFGDVTVGAGVGETERYLVKPKLFYYNPKYSINILTDFNDIGEVPFTRRDYFNFTGGFRNLGRGGTSFNITSDDLAFAVLQNDRANEINTKFGAANFSMSASKTLDISGYGIVSNTKTDLITNTRRTYIDDTADPTDNTIEETFDNTEQRSTLGLLKLSASYRPNNNFRLDYDVFGKLSQQEEDDTFLSVRDDISEDINERLENDPFSVQQNLNAYYTLNSKNIFSFEAQHLFQEEDPFYNAIRSEIPFRGVFTQINDPDDPNSDTFDPLEASERYNVNQQKNVTTSKLDAKLDYYYVLNKKSNLNFTIGSTLSTQNFDSDIFQILDDGDQNSFESEEFTNDVKYNFNDLYAGVHYKFITGIFTFNPGVSIHNYDLKDEQLGTTNSQNEWQVLPDFFALVQFKKSESLRFNYSITANYTDINNLAEGYVFNNYNSLSQGNRSLENALYDNYSLNYFSFNMFNYTNIFARLSYTNRRNPIKNTSIVSGINRVNTPINSNLADQVLSGSGNFTRTFGKIKGNLSANVSWSSFNNIVNTLPSESISLTQTYQTEWSTNFKKGPNFDLGYSITVNDYDNNGAESTFYTSRPFARLDWSFAKGFLLKSSYSYYNYRDTETTLNEYSFWDAEVFYQKPDSKWEYKFSVTNLLDTESINRDSFNELFNSTSSYVVQPRYWIFSVKYNL
ncbi:Outer membrane receptor proteins, mostly Fe transport [Aquimarina amphilecti]|uniref:Outer membrane receptor proteins, mostly Fe transport n=1 Tax=Aquimarina amphilecti TaxID=1038014 RepID=A0A1H7MV54_AQUAM|nr:outer membrane beta-barrel protein [Aquimarina amphilecti]SEL14688.1 Outer membrane receptor proteins, mostly Fe transport [Aquimarina amphilecti]